MEFNSQQHSYLGEDFLFLPKGQTGLKSVQVIAVGEVLAKIRLLTFARFSRFIKGTAQENPL